MVKVQPITYDIKSSRRRGRPPMILDQKPIITARKRSLGQGNIFRIMCKEFCPGEGACSRGGACSWGVGCLLQGYLLWRDACSGGEVPMSGGVPAMGCLVETPPGRLLMRVVRILLECILVWQGFLPKKTHENEINWTGAGGGRFPDVPLGTANEC